MAPRQPRGAATPLLFSALLAVASPRSALSANQMSERDTLLRFYSKSGGSRWTNNDGWREAAEDEDSKKHVCSWHGVQCEEDNNGHKRVTGLSLEDNHLTGHVTPHLWQMPHLEEVNLGGNMLTDAGLTGLSMGDTPSPVAHLILSQNQIESLEGLEAAHSTMVELDISSNAFEGQYPPQVFHLRRLQILRSSFNNGVTGELHPEIGELIHLRELDMSFNSMQGTIPREIGNLAKVEYVILEENKLTGSLPPEMNGMTSLKYLSVMNSGNDAGRLSGPLPSLSDLTHLRELYLAYNGLTGTIPRDFLKHSAVKERQVTIDLSSNMLTGKVPTSLSKFSKLDIELTNNRITDIPSELCDMVHWMDDQVAEYGCDAILCPKGTYSESGRKDYDGVQCVPCLGGEEYGPYLGSTDCIADIVDEEKEGEIDEFANEGVSNGDKNPPYVRPSTRDELPSGGGLTFAAKFFIVLIALAVPITLIGATLWNGVAIARWRARSDMRAEAAKSIPDDGDMEDVDLGSSMDKWQGSFKAKSSSKVGTEPERCIL